MSITVQECDALLPQTNCRECRYDGCLPYAQAMVSGKDICINKCRPGGQETINALAKLFGVSPTSPEQDPLPECNVLVNLDQCIGCTLCIKACPVDAIIGAPKYHHQVIESACTGCQLCLSQCPTSCMEVVPRTLPLPSAQENRHRLLKRQERESSAADRKRQAQRESLAKLSQDPSLLAACLTKSKGSHD